MFNSTGEIEKALKESEAEFLKQSDWDDFKIALYHGTDRFVLDMPEEKRKCYFDACLEYLTAFSKTDIKCLDEKPDSIENNAFLVLEGFKKSSKSYEYGTLYTTSDLNRANVYANQARYFGELGSVVYGIRHYMKRKQISLDGLSKTEEILDSLFGEIESRTPDPVVLKITGKDKIMSMEDGSPFDNKEILIGQYCYGPGFFQESFRMNNDVTLDDFEIIDVEKEKKLADNNLEEIKDNLLRYQKSVFVDKYGYTEEQFDKLILKMKLLGNYKPFK